MTISRKIFLGLIPGCVSLFILTQTGSAQAPPFAWVRQAGGPTEFDFPAAVASDNSGNILVAGSYGRTASFGTNSINSGLNSDNQVAFLAKYSADGNVAWVRSAGGRADGQGHSPAMGLAVDANGNAYITGVFFYTVRFGAFTLTPDSTSFTDNEVFIVKYDPSGNVLWAQRAGVPGSETTDEGTDVAVDSEGNLHVVGIFGPGTANFNGLSLPSFGVNAFHVKYSPSGTALWVTRITGIANMASNWRVATDRDTNSFILGAFGSTATLGTNVLYT